jgi:hypothetical protein
MKKMFALVAFAALSTSAFASDVKYDPKSSPAAIAVNEQVRREIANQEDTPLCLFIWNDKQGSCRVQMTAAGQMDGGGGAGGAAAAGE